MAGFEHSQSPEDKEEDTVSSQQIRYGWGLFVVYCLLYGGFVLLNAFSPSSMQRTPIAGVNIAVLYGLGLIVAAFVTALIYEWICYRIAQMTRRDGKVDR